MTKQAAQKLGDNYRVTHHKDPTPHLVPFSESYRHPGPEYYITTTGTTTTQYPTDVTYFPARFDAKGHAIEEENGSWQWSLDPFAGQEHRWYLIHIAGPEC